jgi:uncharacterized protein
LSHLGLIVKVTRLCNLRCTYCHDWRSTGEIMSFSVLARMISSALQEFDEVQFIWHGGETTVVPIEFYQKAVALQARFLRPGCRVRNDIQTNATRLDDKWATFFKEANFGVGVSVDGPRELHDRHRLDAGGQSSFDNVIRGIELLKRHQVPVSALMVVDEATLAIGPDRIFEFFLERGIPAFGCLDAKPKNQPDALRGTPASTYLGQERMTKFMTRLYDRWLEHGDRNILIQEFALIQSRIAGKGRRSCTMEGNCFGRFFIVEPNGEASHCDLFLGDPAYNFGNVLQLSFTEMAQSEKTARLKQANDHAVNVMREHCPEFATCMGGCPHDRYISYRHNPAHSEKCCGKYSLISHIRSRLREQEQLNPLRVVA